MTSGCGYNGSALVPELLGDNRVEQVVLFDSLYEGARDIAEQLQPWE